MIGLAVLALGGVLLWAAMTKRGDAVLNALNIDLQHNIDVPANVLATGNSNGATNTSATGQTKSFLVPLVGGGSITVNASDPAAAIENVNQQSQNKATGTGVQQV